MPLLRNLVRGLRSLFRKEQVDRELDEELRAYQEMAADEKIKDGMSRKEALRAVRLERGSLAGSKEIVRSGGWEFIVETCLRDFRFGARMLRKSPGFTAVAVLTLALGIGANTAIFAVANALLLKAPPFPNPDRLVYIWGASAIRFESEQERLEWVQAMQRTSTLEQIAVFDTGWANLAGAGAPERILAAETSANLFAVLGVGTLQGRTFLADGNRTADSSAALISERLAVNKFGAANNAIGRILRLNGNPFTVVGVMPAESDFPDKTDVWVPLPADFAGRLMKENALFFSQIARLRPGVTVAQARAEMVTIASQPPSNARDAESAVQVVTMQEAAARDHRRGILLLAAAVGFVLLIACADVANLLLARAAGRRKEMALRAALGATRGRLIRQAFAESLLLAAAGGVGGLFVSGWSLKALAPILPARVGGAAGSHVDYRVLCFVGAVTLASAILFGLLPALSSAKPDVQQDLQEAPTGFAGRIVPYRVRGLLVISEVALAFVLLVGAGLLIRSLERLMRVPTGFQTQHLLTTRLILADDRHKKPEQQTAFYRESLEKIQTLPGVLGAAFVQDLPFGEGPSTMFILRTKEKSATGGGHYMIASPDYFRTLGLPLLAGREFTDADRDGAPKVAIVSKSLANDLWPGENPLGRQIAFYDAKSPWLEVVGVVDDARHFGLDHEAMPMATFYVPLWQSAVPTAFLAVRTSGDPERLSRAVQQAVGTVDKDEPLDSFATMTQLIATRTAEPRSRALLLGIFAGLAVLLAMVGVYGVVSYSVGQRTREMGIRAAMGAGPTDVVCLVIGEGFVLVTLGLALGLGGALGLTRLLSGFLFDVKPTDAATYLIACLAFAGVALLASYLPARRAMRVDPIVALRYE